MQKVLIIIISLFFSVFLLAEPKIGVLLDLNSDIAMYSQAFSEGIQLAVNEQNELGGINGEKINLILEGTDGTPKGSNTGARKLVHIDKVSALILQSYTDVMASYHEFERNRIPAITLWDSSPEIEAVGEYVFGIGLWTPSAGTVSAEFAINKLKARTAIIITNPDPWSESVAKVFKEQFIKNSGKILKEVLFDKDATDFRASITQIKNLNPDVLYIPIAYNIVPVYTQLHSLGFIKPIISSDIISSEHINKAPKVFENIYQSQIQDPATKEYQVLAKTYQLEFKKEVTLPWFVAVGYDGAKLLINAMQKIGLDGEKIKNKLYKVSNYQGASGEISISKQGSRPVVEKMYQVKNSKFSIIM